MVYYFPYSEDNLYNNKKDLKNKIVKTLVTIEPNNQFSISGKLWLVAKFGNGYLIYLFIKHHYKHNEAFLKIVDHL